MQLAGNADETVLLTIRGTDSHRLATGARKAEHLHSAQTKLFVIHDF